MTYKHFEHSMGCFNRADLDSTGYDRIVRSLNFSIYVDLHENLELSAIFPAFPNPPFANVLIFKE